jgi:hypothetical protein
MMVLGFSIWQILGVSSIIILFLSWGSRNAIWGGMTGGGLVGIAAAFFKEGKYDWFYVAKFAIVGLLIGLFFELASYVANKFKS